MRDRFKPKDTYSYVGMMYIAQTIKTNVTDQYWIETRTLHIKLSLAENNWIFPG